MSSQSGTSPATTSAVDEAGAIAAGYAKGHTTAYYIDCKRLPSAQTGSTSGASGSMSSAQTQQQSSQALTQLGDFSFLPHPEYAGRSGKTVNKPLYLHHLVS